MLATIPETNHQLMLVDDDVAFIESAAAVFRGSGFHVRVVDDTAEALKSAQESKADLVLVDLDFRGPEADRSDPRCWRPTCPSDSRIEARHTDHLSVSPSRSLTRLTRGGPVGRRMVRKTRSGSEDRRPASRPKLTLVSSNDSIATGDRER